MLMATSAFAGEHVGTIKVSDPVIYKAFENARAAGAYMMISNMGAEDDLLVDVLRQVNDLFETLDVCGHVLR